MCDLLPQHIPGSCPPSGLAGAIERAREAERATVVKQVILMRTDLKNVEGNKVRSGKLMAQAAHASMIWLAKRVKEFRAAEYPLQFLRFSAPEEEWLLKGSFTKVVVGASSAAELIAVVDAARASGLVAEVVTDNGTTEFGGVPTVTCAAIGPDLASKVDPITRHLKLY